MRRRSGWRVEVAEHDVDRWHIAEQVLELHAANDVQARIEAVREVHRQAGVPPWKPFARRTYLRTSATQLARVG